MENKWYSHISEKHILHIAGLWNNFAFSQE